MTVTPIDVLTYTLPLRDGAPGHLSTRPLPDGSYQALLTTPSGTYRLQNTVWFAPDVVRACAKLDALARRPLRRRRDGEARPALDHTESWVPWTAAEEAAHRESWEERIIDLFNPASYTAGSFDRHLGDLARPIAMGLPPKEALMFAVAAMMVERSTDGGEHGQVMALLRDTMVAYQARGLGDPLAAVDTFLRPCGEAGAAIVELLGIYRADIAKAAGESARAGQVHGWPPPVEPSPEERRIFAELFMARTSGVPHLRPLHDGALPCKKALDVQVDRLREIEAATDAPAALMAGLAASNCGVTMEVIGERLNAWTAAVPGRPGFDVQPNPAYVPPSVP